MSKPIILAENILEQASVLEATTSAPNFDVMHLLDRRQYTFWKATEEGTSYITADLGAKLPADTLCLMGHNFGTSNAKITLQSSDDGTTWADILTELKPNRDTAIIKVFETQSKQHWRLKIEIATDIPYLSIFFLGERLEFPRYVMGDYDPSPQQIHATTSTSKTGYHLGSLIRYISYNITVTFNNLTDTFIRDNFLPVWEEHLSQLKPFFWAWDIDNYPNDVYFVLIPADYNLNIPYNPVRRNLTLQFVGKKE